MRSLRQFVGSVLLVLLIGYPAIACLAADAEMTEAERKCCKEMAQQCGSMSTDMPSSHSCCQQQVTRPNSMLRASFAQVLPSAVTEPISELATIHLRHTPVADFETHVSPESPPGASSILRI